MVVGSTRYWIGAIIALLLGVYIIAAELSDEDNIRLLGGGYYIASYDTGTALHWHDDPENFADEPLLEKVYKTQGNAKYIVARAGIGFYFAFPLQVASRQEAEQKRMGPFSKADLNKKMMQLTGDSALHQLGVF